MHSLVRTSRADLLVRTSRACLLSHACLFSHEPAKRRAPFQACNVENRRVHIVAAARGPPNQKQGAKKKNMFGGLPERRLRSGARRVCRTRRVRETRTR